VREPLVSAVVPAYNAARTLRVAVESILLQTVENIEVIVVDDGSEDNTAEVARAIDDPRVRLISQANGGASAARNAGICRALAFRKASSASPGAGAASLRPSRVRRR
jgi:glycosyltransferase involved in cell wall biosynthesis